MKPFRKIRQIAVKGFNMGIFWKRMTPTVYFFATFGKYYGVILDAEKQNMFYIPEGFAHGFYVLSDEAIFTYKCTDFYDPKGEGGLMWIDPAIAIDWKSVAPDVNPFLSEKDQKHPVFYKTKRYFDKNGKWIGKL